MRRKARFQSNNGCELAVLYCFLFLYLAARGDGMWSVEELLGTRKAFTRRVRNLV